MLVMTQDEMQLIPFDNFVFTVRDDCIVCTDDLVSLIEGICIIIGEYATKERAQEVLHNMACEYENSIVTSERMHGHVTRRKVYRMPER